MTRRCPLSVRVTPPVLWGALLLLVSLTASGAIGSAAAAPHVVYTAPRNGAQLVRLTTGVTLRFDGVLDPNARPTLVVTGSLSGVHDGRTIAARDGRTLVFKPTTPFVYGEQVTVTAGGDPATTFAVVNVAPPDVRIPPDGAAPDLDPLSRYLPLLDASRSPGVESDSLPPEYPTISTQVFEDTAPGYLFMSSFGGRDRPYLLIVNNDGTPIFYRQMVQMCTDFKLQPNGQLTYFNNVGDQFYALDENYDIVDSVACANGYDTDEHELRILPNGHYLLLGDDAETVDMSQIVPGGYPTATVIGNIIQELDEDKNVVFEWRSWDHFLITDTTHEPLTASVIDYEHANALDVDHDGNILLSSRHMDEITKIDRETGDTIWRWGGKNNEFTQNDPEGFFSHQHAVRRQDSGTVTMFDNGDYRSPPYSRAAEYTLDETNKVATLVWEFRNTPDSYGNAMGYVQRLDNGSTLVTFGTGDPDALEIDSSGNKVFQANLPPGESSYRTFRQEWDPTVAGVGPLFGPHPAVALSLPTPNPSRGQSAIMLTLAQASPVTLELVDVRGRIVRRLLDDTLRAPGTTRVAIDLTGSPSGVYFARARTSAGTVTRRLVHLD